MPVLSGLGMRGDFVFKGEGEGRGVEGVCGALFGIALLEEVPKFSLATRGVWRPPPPGASCCGWRVRAGHSRLAGRRAGIGVGAGKEA